MKRLYTLLFILVILSSCSKTDTPKTLQTPAAESVRIVREHSTPVQDSSFTLMWYVNGSDLESGGGEDYGGAFSRNLQEVMSQLPKDDSVTVIIFSGGTSKWETVGFEADINQAHFITKDGLLHGERLPEGGIADAQTLADFVAYAIETCPADRYGLVFWDHGSSVPIGFGFDELREPRSINARDIALGLDAGLGGKRLSFIGFDTCLMATAETAALCAPYADYLIASEELEPNAGWNYAPLMQMLTSNPSVDTLKLCKTIADAYYNASLWFNPLEPITVSVTDLSKMGEVVKATEAFALAAKDDLNVGGFRSISKRRAGAKGFGGAGESSDMVDLAHLAQRFNSRYPNESKALMSAVRQSVAYNRHSKTSPNSNGLSIYFPFENEAIIEGYLDVYLAMGFTKAYVEFIEEFSARLNAGDADTKNIKIPVEKRNDRYTIKMPENIRDDIISLRAALLGRESDDIYYILSYVPNVRFKAETGRGSVKLPVEWLTMDGILVCAHTESAPEGRTLYSIPVKINDRDMNILYTRDKSTFYQIGAAADGDEDTIAAPGFLPIVDGDIITPKYLRLNLNSGREEDGYYLGESFTVSGNNLRLGFSALGEGKHYFAFYLTDIYDNHFLSMITAVD